MFYIVLFERVKMGKGGPLAFLNKKHFHTGSIRNVEEVWKREQKAAREEARLEELQKQIAQERQLEELEHLAERAGHSKHPISQSDALRFSLGLKNDWIGCTEVVWSKKQTNRERRKRRKKCPNLPNWILQKRQQGQGLDKFPSKLFFVLDQSSFVSSFVLCRRYSKVCK